MAPKRLDAVPRPLKKSEYAITFASRGAAQGWQDLLATARNQLTEAWDHLTKSPHTVSTQCYPLKGELGLVTRAGTTYERWQYKPTVGGTARIWYYVDAQVVHLERVFTSHPNQTK